MAGVVTAWEEIGEGDLVSGPFAGGARAAVVPRREGGWTWVVMRRGATVASGIARSVAEGKAAAEIAGRGTDVELVVDPDDGALF